MSKGWPAAVILLILGVSASVVAQQTAPAAATGVIAGTLTVGGASEPVRKAQVRLVSTTPRATRTATTDQDGRFVFLNVPPADYTLSASKPNFLEMVYGARKPGASLPGTTIKLGTGQRIDKLTFSLPRGGVIAGTILDELGDPAFETRVTALRFAYANGERTLRLSGQVVTDDRGQYRIAGQLPGEYLVSALPPETVAIAAASAASQRARMLEIAAQIRREGDVARAAEIERSLQDSAPAASNTTGYVPVYFPGAVQPSAAGRVSLGLGEELGGIDMRLQIVQTATVTGTVTSAEATPAEINIQLVDPAMPVASVGVWFRTVKDGKFTFYGVLPGTYALRANAALLPAAAGGTAELLRAAKEIVVTAGQPTDHELRLERGVSVSGALALDTLRGVVDSSKLRVELRPIATSADWEMPAWNGPVDAQGRFVAKSVVPGRFRVSVSGLPVGWFLASAVFAGKDAADYHLTVEPGGSYAGALRFTDRMSDIVGTITNAMGAPAPDQTVIVFPESREFWLPESRRIQVVRPEADGKYLARGLPPGDYRIAAVLDPETGAWFDREWLGRLVPLAVPVTLGEGDRKMQDLRVR